MATAGSGHRAISDDPLRKRYDLDQRLGIPGSALGWYGSTQQATPVIGADTSNALSISR